MKTIKYTLATLMVATIVAVVLVGCKKENEPQNNNNGNPTEVAQQQNGDAVERIVNFKKQLAYYKANSGIKDGEKVSLEDAVWNIENTFDATYAFPEDAYGETRTQDFTLHLDVDADGNVLLTDLTAFYDQMVADARTAYANDGFTDKIFISLMAETLETRGDGVDVKITMTSGERTNVGNNPPEVHVDGPFGVDDNWKYAFGMGKCDTMVFGGADFQLQEHLRLLIRSAISEPQSGCRNIYVNRQPVYYIGGDYPGLFYRTDTADVCIEWVYMNDYYQAEKRTIFTTIPNDPEQHVTGEAIGISINGSSGVNAQSHTPYITHSHTIEYADRVEASIESIGLAEDLLND
ncbi:MAG: hypothetical protein MJZ94_11430 [Bacteroidales bacterium]|nr:hypothetical protein [Bacteroidales bacterium]